MILMYLLDIRGDKHRKERPKSIGMIFLIMTRHNKDYIQKPLYDKSK